jgi:hypothetical protein
VRIAKLESIGGLHAALEDRTTQSVRVELLRAGVVREKAWSRKRGETKRSEPQRSGSRSS